MNTDSPLNYACPACWSPPFTLCTAPDGEYQDTFHNGRRAARMAALARQSTPPDNRGYRRGNLNHGDCTFGHRGTAIKRPDPQLPFDDDPFGVPFMEGLAWSSEHRSYVRETPAEAYKAAVRKAVDLILEAHPVDDYLVTWPEDES